MNSIIDNNPHVIKIAPGTYVETATITLKTNIDLEGSGQGRTTIICTCATVNIPDAVALSIIGTTDQPHLDIINIYVAGTVNNLGIVVDTTAGHVVVRNSWSPAVAPASACTRTGESQSGRVHHQRHDRRYGVPLHQRPGHAREPCELPLARRRRRTRTRRSARKSPSDL